MRGVRGLVRGGADDRIRLASGASSLNAATFVKEGQMPELGGHRKDWVRPFASFRSIVTGTRDRCAISAREDGPQLLQLRPDLCLVTRILANDLAKHAREHALGGHEFVGDLLRRFEPQP